MFWDSSFCLITDELFNLFFFIFNLLLWKASHLNSVSKCGLVDVFIWKLKSENFIDSHNSLLENGWFKRKKKKISGRKSGRTLHIFWLKKVFVLKEIKICKQCPNIFLKYLKEVYWCPVDNNSDLAEISGGNASTVICWYNQRSVSNSINNYLNGTTSDKLKPILFSEESEVLDLPEESIFRSF